MKDLITVGQIIKPLGIRGEVKVKPLTDTPGELMSLKSVFIGDVNYDVLRVRPLDKAVAFALKGIADRNAAELFRNLQVLANRKDLPALDDGRYYIVDLIGCNVYTDDEAFIGAVTDIKNLGAADVIEVSGEFFWLFPHLKDLVMSVDTKAKKIILDKVRFLQVAVKQDTGKK